jgi:ParB-like chromosome segregation protein Spo0J
LIYGARRLFTAQQLGVDLLVDVRDIDDRAALIEMDIENRPREDISPYERGVNYGRWLRAGYFKNQMELAKELGISEARVSRLLKYSQLPAVVVAVFDSVRDIREEWAVRLANKCRDPKQRSDIMRRARERAAAPRKNSPQCIFEALLRGATAKTIKESSRDEVIRGSNGKSLFRIAVHAKTLHVVLPRAEVSPEILEDITRAVAAALERQSSAGDPRRTLRKQEIARPRALSSPGIAL